MDAMGRAIVVDWDYEIADRLKRMPYLNYLTASYVIAQALIPRSGALDADGRRLTNEALAIVRATIDSGDHESHRTAAYTQTLAMRAYLRPSLRADLERPIRSGQALVGELAGVVFLYGAADFLPSLAAYISDPALTALCERLDTMCRYAAASKGVPQLEELRRIALP
jgi:hypothetical protein